MDPSKVGFSSAWKPNDISDLRRSRNNEDNSWHRRNGAQGTRKLTAVQTLSDLLRHLRFTWGKSTCYVRQVYPIIFMVYTTASRPMQISKAAATGGTELHRIN